MTTKIPVPWLQWRRFKVSGVVREEGSGRPLAGLQVQAFDEDMISDDFLGECLTDAEGRFEIRFLDSAFKDVVETRPDLYLIVVDPEAGVIHDTSFDVRRNAEHEEVFEIVLRAADTE